MFQPNDVLTPQQAEEFKKLWSKRKEDPRNVLPPDQYRELRILEWMVDTPGTTYKEASKIADSLPDKRD